MERCVRESNVSQRFRYSKNKFKSVCVCEAETLFLFQRVRSRGGGLTSLGKGSKFKIAPYWKDAEALNSSGVELYIPFRGGEHLVATKVTSFQIGGLEIVDIPDFTDSSKEIKGQNIFIE